MTIYVSKAKNQPSAKGFAAQGYMGGFLRTSLFSAAASTALLFAFMSNEAAWAQAAPSPVAPTSQQLAPTREEIDRRPQDQAPRSARLKIDGDIERRRARNPGAELFAFENSRRIVLDPFADDYLAADVHQIEHAAHGVARSRVGRFLVAASEPAQRIKRGRFGRAHEIELNNALDVVVTYFRQPMHDGR